MTLNITYIQDNDTYYFPHKEIYVKRWMFAFASEQYMMSMLGLNSEQYQAIANELIRVPRSEHMTFAVKNVTD